MKSGGALTHADNIGGYTGVMGEDALALAYGEARAYVKKQVAAFAEEAMREGHAFFRCGRRSMDRGFSIELMFGDAAGQYYTRDLSCRRFFAQRGVELHAKEADDLLDVAHMVVMHTPGFELLRTARRRLPAPAKKR